MTNMLANSLFTCGSFSPGSTKKWLSFERKYAFHEKKCKGRFMHAAISCDAEIISVEINRPLGIILESVENSRGAIVAEVVEGGNASKTRKIDKGDILMSVEVDGSIYDCGPNILFDDILEHISESPGKNAIILNLSRATSVSSSVLDEVSNYWEQKKEKKKSGPRVLRRTVGVDPKNIRVYRNGLIGEGSFGKVFLGEWKGQKVILKSSKSNVMGADELLDSELEINEYVHRNAKGSCAQFFGCCEIDERDSGNLYDESLPAGLWLMWAYEAENTLQNALNCDESKSLELLSSNYASCSSSFPFELYQRISADLLICLSKIHAIGVVHRDVKPENIILTKNGVKFIDLGGAALCLDQPISYEPGVGPADPRYSKPDDKYLLPTNADTPESGNLEKLWSEYMPEKFDIFAVGLVILQLMVPSLRNPNELDKFKVELEECGYDFMLWRKDFCSFSTDELWLLDIRNGAGNEIIANMLSPTRFSRKKAEEVLEHRFFAVKDDDI